MVLTTATVSRDGQRCEVPFEDLVPGDIVHLSAGDMVPADVRLCREGSVRQPVRPDRRGAAGREVDSAPLGSAATPTNALDSRNLCFMGTNRRQRHRRRRWSSSRVRARSSARWRRASSDQRALTSFDQGVNRCDLGADPLHVGHGPGRLSAQRVRQGRLERGLPVCDRRRGRPHARNAADGRHGQSGAGRGRDVAQKVIVKRLNAIQNLGAMDVLCTDKTGTLTQDRVILEKHLESTGEVRSACARICRI